MVDKKIILMVSLIFIFSLSFLSDAVRAEDWELIESQGFTVETKEWELIESQGFTVRTEEWELIESQGFTVSSTIIEPIQVSIVDINKKLLEHNDIFEMEVGFVNLGTADQTIETRLYVNKNIIETRDVFVEGESIYFDTYTWDTSGYDTGVYEVFIETDDWYDFINVHLGDMKELGEFIIEKPDIDEDWLDMLSQYDAGFLSLFSGLDDSLETPAKLFVSLLILLGVGIISAYYTSFKVGMASMLVVSIFFQLVGWMPDEVTIVLILGTALVIINWMFDMFSGTNG